MARRGTERKTKEAAIARIEKASSAHTEIEGAQIKRLSAQEAHDPNFALKGRLR